MQKKEITTDKKALAFPVTTEEQTALECPMREVPGGGYVHVPWSR